MSARSALVGWTGLVGGNLAARRSYDLQVNSRNPQELTGRFGRVVFSAARAEKWRANQDPATDSAQIADLERMLEGFVCDELVLISTVDVYGTPDGVDEDTMPTTSGLHPYGANRLRLEQTARDAHPRVLVLRLPALFGPGLKKNVIHDLMHGHRVEHIQPASEFQYYDLRRLADDLDVASDAGLDLLNVATEPVATAEVMRSVFDLPPVRSDTPVVRYDMRSRHAGLFGGDGPYLVRRPEVLSGLRSFLTAERAAA